MTHGSRCKTCQRGHEARRPPYRRAYSDPAYQAAREVLRGAPCHVCGGPSDTIDHVVSLAAGGRNHPSNWAPACRSCNSSKGAHVTQA